MNTVHRIKLTQSICTLLILLTSTSLVCAYPPDNAAVLYYRACLIYDANDTMTKKVSDLVKGNIGIDKEIKDYVQKNKFAIKYFADAGDAPNCDWGLDYSEGIELQMPQLAPLKTLSRIVLAQAKIDADSEEDDTALKGVSDLTDMDELETKLDLARAYRDMGDNDSAKDIVAEVIEKGNATQKKQAQVLFGDLI